MEWKLPPPARQCYRRKMATVEITEHTLSEDTKKDIAKALWGGDNHTPTDQTIVYLEAFLRYYRNILRDEKPLQKHILYFVDLLKWNPAAKRSDLKTYVEKLNNPSAPNTGSQVNPPPDSAGCEEVKKSLQEHKLDVDSALAVSVRVLFAINLDPRSEFTEGTISFDQSQVIWEATKTLKQLMDTFPKSDPLR